MPSPKHGTAQRCVCGEFSAVWSGYICPRCGVLNRPLYENESVRPAVARQMTDDDILAELALAETPVGVYQSDERRSSVR